MKKYFLAFLLLSGSTTLNAQWSVQQKIDKFQHLILGDSSNWTDATHCCTVIVGLCYPPFDMKENQKAVSLLTYNYFRFTNSFINADTNRVMKSIELIFCCKFSSGLLVNGKFDKSLLEGDTLKTENDRFKALLHILPFEKGTSHRNDTISIGIMPNERTPPIINRDGYCALLAEVIHYYVIERRHQTVNVYFFQSDSMMLYSFPPGSDFQPKSGKVIDLIDHNRPQDFMDLQAGLNVPGSEMRWKRKHLSMPAAFFPLFAAL
ncbi:hypothetical protein PV783_13550 [Chitinophaga sp. CC14]|uniref:hypothetical protein n=1 Tax=Chitinophaga sp. CC14 TaxID=3029199 RepID=UPI003B7B23F1